MALNGDGGDEVLRRLPAPLRRRALRARPALGSSRAASAVLGLLPEPSDRKHPLRFAKRFAEAGRAAAARALPALERVLHRRPRATAAPGAACACGRPRARAARASTRACAGEGSTLARLLQLNFETYLLDDLLVKMDRMSMAHGLEARSPFLDTALVEFGARLARPAAHAPAARASCCCAGPCKGILPRVDPGARQDGLRRAARRLVPRRPARASCASACSSATSPLYEYLRPEPVARACVARHVRRPRDLLAADLGAADPRELAAPGRRLGDASRGSTLRRA